MLGAFTKRAQFPFRAWLPLAIAAPTPISSLVHSSTLVTAGVYLFVRFSVIFKNKDFLIRRLLIFSGITILLAGLRASVELDIKKIIAYSTLSQLGLMMIVVIIGEEVLGFFHVLTHALFKALLFLCSGVFIHECLENQDIRQYNFTLKSNPIISRIFYICRLRLIGFPFLRGFYSKDLILELVYSINYNYFYLIILIIIISFTTFYSIRLISLSLILGKLRNKIIYYSN